MRIRRATGDKDIDGKDLFHTAEAGVILAENAAAAGARAYGHYQARGRHGLVRSPQSKFHVP